WPYFWENGETDITKFSTAARLWLAQYEMLVPDLFREDGSGLMIPVYDRIGNQVGMQRRMFKGSAKYLTYINKGYSFSYMGERGVANTLYIVEDLLSACKLNQAGMNVMCAMGTSLQTLPVFVGELIIWLDDDEAGHRGALKLARELGAISEKVTTMFNKQPKEIPMSILKTMPGATV
ncbi:MAG TPA: hypothetical protein V6D20_01285, partial [Candidatus Obscuribacterales bacterium]